MTKRDTALKNLEKAHAAIQHKRGKSAFSLRALEIAVTNLEKRKKINYLEKIVEQSLDNPALAKIVIDRLLPEPAKDLNVKFPGRMVLVIHNDEEFK